MKNTRLLSVLPFLLLALLAYLRWGIHPEPPPPQPTPARPAPAPRRPKLYVFSTKPCPWCVKLEKSLADPRVADALANYEVTELDISSAEGRKLRVRSAPTLVIVGRASKPEVKTGYQTPEQLLAWLKTAQGAGRVVPDSMHVDTTVTVQLPPEMIALAADLHNDRQLIGLGGAVLLACAVALTFRQIGRA